MHSRQLAHMDIKPHNVLISRPRHQEPVSRTGAPTHQSMMSSRTDEEDVDLEAGASLVRCLLMFISYVLIAIQCCSIYGC